jgi:hypothetical protein
METTFKITNYQDLLTMLNGLEPALQSSKVVKEGLNVAGNVINKQAELNLRATKLSKSKTGYSYYANAFQLQALKARNTTELGGVKIGVSKKAWKLRFIQWGTKERSYFITAKKGDKNYDKRGTTRKTGFIKKTNFFYGAVKAKEKEAYSIISDAIMKSLQKNLNK